MKSKPPVVPHRIELKLREMGQLFNSIDPSPFPDRDLDSDAEEFILGWVGEYSLAEPVALVVHLAEFPAGEHPQVVIEQGVHHYFEYRARLNAIEFRRLLRKGRQSLFIGLGFLVVCLTAGNAIGGDAAGHFRGILREGLIICGWVAMWQPMQIYLYDWWPVHHRGKLYEKLSRMKVEVRQRG